MNPQKNYFGEDSHLTEAAFWDLIHGEPDELSRLEIAEHLSFCDQCTDRYTQLLLDQELQEPESPVLPGLMVRIRRKVLSVLFNRYVAAAAAACFAITFWINGVFQPNLPTKKPGASQNSPSFTVVDKASEFGQKWSDSIQQFFLQFDLKGVL